MSGLISGEETIAQAATIVKVYDGFRATPYRCEAKRLTIGFGRTSDVKEGDVTTVEKELDWLEARLEKDLVWLRNKLQPLVLEANQEAALLSLVYNIGQGNFMKSGVFRYLRNAHNGEKLPLKLMEASWLSWNKIGGKPSKGLTNRRLAEWDLFTKP